MQKAIAATLFLSLLCPALVLASGPSSPARAPFAEQDALTVTETIRCVVTEIREDGVIIVQDVDESPAHPLPFGKKTKFVAQNKNEFDGKKKLAAADLKVGHQLKVTVRPATGEVVRVKVLKST